MQLEFHILYEKKKKQIKDSNNLPFENHTRNVNAYVQTNCILSHVLLYYPFCISDFSTLYVNFLLLNSMLIRIFP